MPPLEEEPLTKLSNRTQNILRELGISNLAELRKLTLHRLLTTRNAGPVTARELIDFLWNRL